MINYDIMAKKKVTCVLLFFAVILYWIVIYISEDNFAFAKGCSVLIVWLIFTFLYLQKELVIFSPITLFCIVYLTIPITNFYFIQTDFVNTIYFSKFELKKNYIDLFNKACLYYFIGLLSMLLGFISIKPAKVEKFNLNIEKIYHSKIILMIAVFLMGVGVINFFYNVSVYAGGNVFTYFGNVALRKHEFEDNSQGTTVGYNLYYIGSYILLFYYFLKKRRLSLLFWCLVIVGVAIKGSTGRIYSTLVYLISFLSMSYFHTIYLGKIKSLNKKYIVALTIIPLLGVFFYFFRLYSSLSINNTESISIAEASSQFLDVIGYYSFDKGNTPNVALFMKILDSWESDHGYFYGLSLFSGIFPLSFFVEHGAKTSIVVKELWYMHLPGGALPTTAVGEMYMNFGVLGVVFGMFLVGLFLKLFYNYCVNKATFTSYLVLTQISLSFVAIYPKVDLTNLGIYWVLMGIFPLIIVRIFLYSYRFIVQSRRLT